MTAPRRPRAKAAPRRPRKSPAKVTGPCTVERLGQPQHFDGNRLNRAWCLDTVTVFPNGAEAQAAIQQTVDLWEDPQDRERIGTAIFTIHPAGVPPHA